MLTKMRLRKKRRERKRMRRIKRLKVLCVIILMAITVMLITSYTLREKDIPDRYEYTRLDVLWDVLAMCPEDTDRWEFIHEVMDINGMTDMTVHPARLYQVPIYEK